MDLCSKIKCVPPPKNEKEKDKAAMAPNLTGVEKFLRAKVIAEAASAAARAEELILREGLADGARAEGEEANLSGKKDGP